MAKKRSVEDRDVLKFKLQALQEYIAHYERVLDQFGIDLQKARLFRGPRDPEGFIDHVTAIVTELYNAAPPTSLIEDDLAKARAEVNAAYDASPEWAEIRGRLIESGAPDVSVEAGFDSILSYTMNLVLYTLQSIHEARASAGKYDGLVDDLFTAMEHARVVLNAALDPALHLRKMWVNALSGRTAKSADSARRGRTKDPEIAIRDAKICKAWETGIYRTYAEVGKEFGVKSEVVRKAVARERLRRKGRS